MCIQKIEENEVCINTKCSHHMCWNELKLKRPNLFSTIGWVFQNCMVNLQVLEDYDRYRKFGHNFIIFDDIALMWGVSFERIRQIEEEGLKHFKNNLKSLEGGI